VPTDTKEVDTETDVSTLYPVDKCYPSTEPSPIVYHTCGTVTCPPLDEANVLTSGWKDTWELIHLNYIYNFGCEDQTPGEVDLYEMLGVRATTTLDELARYSIEITFPNQPFASYTGTFLFVNNKIDKMCIETVESEYFPDCFIIPAMASIQYTPEEQEGILRVVNIGVPEPPDLDFDGKPETNHLTLDMYFKRVAKDQ